MVADSRAAPSPGGIRPLDEPQLVQVEVGADDRPSRVRLEPALSLHASVGRHRQVVRQAQDERAISNPFVLSLSKDGGYLQSGATEGAGTGLPKERWREVPEILDSWRIDDEWWRKQPVSRLYYRVLLEDGTVVGLFKDLVSGEWYRQRV